MRIETKTTFAGKTRVVMRPHPNRKVTPCPRPYSTSSSSSPPCSLEPPSPTCTCSAFFSRPRRSRSCASLRWGRPSTHLVCTVTSETSTRPWRSTSPTSESQKPKSPSNRDLGFCFFLTLLYMETFYARGNCARCFRQSRLRGLRDYISAKGGGKVRASGLRRYRACRQSNHLR